MVGDLVQNLVLFCLLWFKFMFYLRIFDSFGMIVELFLGMRVKLQPFIIFLFLINGFFTIVFTVIGCSFGEGTNTSYAFFSFM